MDTEPCLTCDICQSTSFFEEHGNYWCSECQTMSQNVAVMVNENVGVAEVDEDHEQSNVIASETIGGPQELTSYELLTQILKGLLLELIDLGVSPNIYKVAKILWLNYLKKCGIIFNEHKVPILPACFKARDIGILYGVQGLTTRKIITGKSSTKKRKILPRRKNKLTKKRIQKKIMDRIIMESEGETSTGGKTSQSSGLSDSNYETDEDKITDIKLLPGAYDYLKKAKSHYNKQTNKLFRGTNAEGSLYTKVQRITAIDVLVIIRIALMFTNSQYIQLGDLFRLASNGYLSLGNIQKFLPEKYRSFKLLRFNFTQISRKSFQLRCSSSCALLNMKFTKSFDIMILIERYVKELELPDKLLIHIKKVVELVPQPQCEHNLIPFNFYIPEYDVIAMAFILVSLKILFGLDGATENDLSLIAKKINKKQSNSNEKQFEFSKWLDYLICRKTVIANVHNMSFEAAYIGMTQHRLAFQTISKFKNDRTTLTSRLGSTRKDLRSRFKSELKKLPIEKDKLNDVVKSPLSLGKPYLSQWIEDILVQYSHQLHPSVRDILMQDFNKTSFDYLDPEKCKNLLSQYNYKVSVNKGRSKRSHVTNSICMQDLFEPTYKHVPSVERVCISITSDENIKQEVPTIIENIIKSSNEYLSKNIINDNINIENINVNDDDGNINNNDCHGDDSNNLILYIPRYCYWLMFDKNIFQMHSSRFKYYNINNKNMFSTLRKLSNNNFYFLLSECCEFIRSPVYNLYSTMSVLEYCIITNEQSNLFWQHGISSNKK